jgi:hypothetical protein
VALVSLPRKAGDLQPGDVLVDGDGNAWPTWSTGQPMQVTRVELVARITFGDYRTAEYPFDHELDVKEES